MKPDTDEFKNARTAIEGAQRRWAHRRGIPLNGSGRCKREADNFFGGLSDAGRREFRDGGGSELGTADAPGKILSVYSSSALACNVFDYWRQRDHRPLSAALGFPDEPFQALTLEHKLPTGNGRALANLDVVLSGPGSTVHGIEAKCCEPYRPSKKKSALAASYFSRERWTEVGLPGCQAVAESLRREDHDFHVLDVAQLLKHMLALARTAKAWSLCCLWFEIPGVVADRHRLELDRFQALIGVPTFSALTYQELCARLVPLLGREHAAYASYLSDRYGFGA